MYTRQLGGAQSVVTSDGKAIHRTHLIGPHPILQHFLERMDFARLVRSCLGHPRPLLLDHAQTLSVFIQNIILSRAPLYRIAEWARPIDPAALSLTAKEKQSLNDDRVARSLDALVSPRARSLFFHLALHIIEQFELETQRIHHDTTTVTFHGDYRSSFGDPKITHGHNKDHRPDLKQLVFGLNVTADGAVPLSHDVYSGNKTDDTVHRGNVDHLRKILGRADFVYVADSKLCTQKNLAHVAEYGGKFVTVLPRTRSEDQCFRKALREGMPVRWRRLVALENKRRRKDPPDVYASTGEGPQRTSEGYRIVWIRSSQKAELDARIRQSTLEKAEADFFDLDAKLNRGKLRKKAAIAKKVEEILAKHQTQPFLTVRIASRVRIRMGRLRRGRPRKDDPVREVRTGVYHLEVHRNKQALKAEAKTDGVFPLATNLDANGVPKKEVLLIYKYQPYVEKRHALFKTELEVAPVYIKKPRRAAGLVHAVFLAMTLDALIERTLRKAMAKEGIEALPILPEGRMTTTPTTARLLEMFSNVCWYEFEQGDKKIAFPIELTPLQKQLLRLLEIDPSVYA